MLDINTILHTRDGRRIGNAIIIDKKKEDNLFAIKTDYGNVDILSGKEIRSLFHITNQEFSAEEMESMPDPRGAHKYKVDV